jgi:hypothetical protein
MTKATRVYITPPTNTSARHSRRSILGAIAGSAAAVGTIAGLSPVIAEPAAAPAIDPIYEVIERHRKACAAHNEAIDTHMDFEELGMTGAKLEKYNSLVAETDAAYDRLEDVGLDLINTQPTTLAGIFALCQYIKPLFAEDDAPDLPQYILYDDDRTAYPAEAFAYVIGRAVEEMMTAAAGKAVQS